MRTERQKKMKSTKIKVARSGFHVIPFRFRPISFHFRRFVPTLKHKNVTEFVFF